MITYINTDAIILITLFVWAWLIVSEPDKLLDFIPRWFLTLKFWKPLFSKINQLLTCSVCLATEVSIIYFLIDYTDLYTLAINTAIITVINRILQLIYNRL